MDLKELMRLCFNAGIEDATDNLGFVIWWEELGEDRYREFLEGEADPEVRQVLKGLLNTLETVIDTANSKGGTDFVKGEDMRWGTRAVELIERLQTEEG